MGAYNTATKLFGPIGKLSGPDLNQNNIDLLATAARTPQVIPSAQQFYTDHGAQLMRMGDRAFFGAAAANSGKANRDTEPRDWLSDVMGATSIGAYATWGAQVASLARFGTIGFLGGSRTSDARAAAAMLGYTPSSIGIASWAINDDTANPTTTTGYAYYAEAWRMPGVNYQPTFCMEIEGVNFGGAPTGLSTPYQTNIGGGTYGFQIGSGGGQTSGTSDAQAGIVFVANPNRWQTGIIFGAVSIAGTDGSAADNGFGEAISFGRNHGMTWKTPEVSGGIPGLLTGALIRSTVSVSAQGGRMEFQNGAILFTNSVGQQTFSVQSIANPVATLQAQPGVGSGAASIQVQSGGPNQNLGLYPGSGGEIQTAGPVTAPGNAMATQPQGWLHININGADVRVPFFSPTQAGG